MDVLSGISKVSFLVPHRFPGIHKGEDFVVGVYDLIFLLFLFLFHLSLRLILILYSLISKGLKRSQKLLEIVQDRPILLLIAANIFFQMLYNLLERSDLKFLGFIILWIKLEVNQLSILIQEFRFHLVTPLLLLPIVLQSHLDLFKKVIEFIFLWLLPIFVIVWLLLVFIF